MSVFVGQPELLRRFRAGERDAFEQVYRCYVDDVLRLLRGGFSTASGDGVAYVPGITDRSQLLDVTQEVFVRAFGPSGRAGFDGLRPYRPYLLRIARNLRIDQLRSSGREVLVDPSSPKGRPGLDLDALLARDAPVPGAETLHADELRIATASYVEGLPQEERRFVALRFDEGLSQADVAASMAVTRRRVRTLESTVLSGLRRFLARKGMGVRA